MVSQIWNMVSDLKSSRVSWIKTVINADHKLIVSMFKLNYALHIIKSHANGCNIVG